MNLEQQIAGLSNEEQAEILNEYYRDLEEFENWKQEQFELQLKQEELDEYYTYISTSDDKEHKIQMNIVGIDAIGVNAIPNDIDQFIQYLKRESKKSGLFYNKNNTHNLSYTNNSKNREFFKGSGFFGAVYLIFNKNLRYENNKYNVQLTIYPTKFNGKDQLLKQFEQFLTFFDTSKQSKNWELSRLDIAFTSFKNLSKHYFHRKYTQNYEVFYNVKSDSNSSIKELETAAIGSRSGADFYYRMYNKITQKTAKNQMKSNRINEIKKTFPNIWRFEIEIKKNGLKKWRDCLENFTLKRPNYLENDNLKPIDKVMIAGFLADNSLFSIVEKRTAKKYRDLIANLKSDDDVIEVYQRLLEQEEQRIIDTVKKWVNIDI